MDPAEPTRSASPFLGPPGAVGDACVRVCARVCTRVRSTVCMPCSQHAPSGAAPGGRGE